MHRRVGQLDGTVRAALGPRVLLAEGDDERQHQGQRHGAGPQRSDGGEAGALEGGPPGHRARRRGGARRTEQEQEVAGDDGKEQSHAQVVDLRDRGDAVGQREGDDRPAGLFQGVDQQADDDEQHAGQEQDQPAEPRREGHRRDACADGGHAVGRQPPQRGEPAASRVGDGESAPHQDGADGHQLRGQRREPGGPQQPEGQADGGRDEQHGQHLQQPVGAGDQRRERDQRKPDGRGGRGTREGVVDVSHGSTLRHTSVTVSPGA